MQQVRAIPLFHELSNEQIGQCLEMLYCGFAWSESEEGHAYWAEVARKLGRLCDRTAEGADVVRAFTNAG